MANEIPEQKIDPQAEVTVFISHNGCSHIRKTSIWGDDLLEHYVRQEDGTYHNRHLESFEDCPVCRKLKEQAERIVYQQTIIDGAIDTALKFALPHQVTYSSPTRGERILASFLTQQDYRLFTARCRGTVADILQSLLNEACHNTVSADLAGLGPEDMPGGMTAYQELRAAAVQMLKELKHLETHICQYPPPETEGPLYCYVCGRPGDI